MKFRCCNCEFTTEDVIEAGEHNFRVGYASSEAHNVVPEEKCVMCVAKCSHN